MWRKSIGLCSAGLVCIFMLIVCVNSTLAQDKFEAKNASGILNGTEGEKENTLPDRVIMDSKTVNRSAFVVETPFWFENSKANKNENPILFRVFGFTQEQLESEIVLALESNVAGYLERFLGADMLQYVEFSDQDLKSLIVRREEKSGTYFDGKQANVVKFFFAKIEFNETFHERVKRLWIAERQKNRLVQHGLFAGVTLLLIGLIFGGLKLNSATSGFYQGRLQFFTAIVILVVIAAGVYFGSQIAWI